MANDLDIEVQDEEFNEFLDDSEDGSSSNKVSFQLDSDGNVIGDVEDTEVEVVLPSEEEPIEVTPEVESPVEEEAAEEPEAVKKEEKKKKTEKKRKSRAKERIKQQNSQIKQLEGVIAVQTEEMAKLRAEYDETTSTYAQVELERLTGDVAVLEANLKRAAEDGDAEAIAKITSQLVQSQTHIQNLQKVVDNPEPSGTPKQSQNTAPPAQAGLSEAAEDWTEGKEFLINNDDYKELTVEQRKKLSPVRQAMADTARQLLAEGFTNDDPMFYEEMDIRLGNKFDFYEGLAEDGLDALEYTNSDKESIPNDASGETEKPQKSNKSKNVPAKGASRSSSPNLEASANSKNKVVITQDMHKYWKNHLEPNGITLQEYAQEILKDQQRTKF